MSAADERGEASPRPDVAGDVEARVAASGLLAGPVVVLLSGGRDSVCLLDLAVRLAGPVVALHVNYGLRDEADADEAHCRNLCERLEVPLEVVRAGTPEGNLQAWARELRYGAAERLEGAIAVGHTATDQAETVLYRLVASPGRRALLGMPARSGRVIRPLLGLTRAETAAYCEARGLPWREDATNATTTRGRIREILALHPAAEANVARTLEQLRDEAAVLDTLIDPDADLTTLPPALARLTVQRIAEPAPVAEHMDDDPRAGRARRDGARRPARRGPAHRGVRPRRDGSRGPRVGAATAVAAGRAGPGGVRRRRGVVRARRVRDRRRDARRGGARLRPGSARVAGGGSDAPARARRHEVPAGPVHRPQGPAGSAAPAPGGGLRRRDRVGSGRRHG